MGIVHLTLPTRFNAKKEKLPFFLAMEEFAARELTEYSELFFMWQVPPTVIFGRNQDILNEVDLKFCSHNNIEFYRRKSGGGCVYADEGNIMLSYITTSDEVTTTFSAYTSRIASVLRSLGLNAEATGRNDILVDGKKVSGNAFYHIPHRSIVHGTMLFSTNIDNMLGALTPSSDKLQSKGIKSVHSRITTLDSRLSMGVEEFKAYVLDQLCDDEHQLTYDDIRDIRKIESTYKSQSFRFGRAPFAKVTRKEHFDGVGEVEAAFDIVDGIICHFSLSGDFFPVGDINTLVSVLENVVYDASAITDALDGIDVSKIIMNLSNEQFINLIIS